MTDLPKSQLSPLSNEMWPTAIDDLASQFAGRLNVYRVMAHNPALVRAWVDLRQHIVLDTSLGRERSEIVILRAATHLKSDYEWNHHLARSRTLGLSDQRIASLRGPLSEMTSEDAILAGAVDDLMAGARVQPQTLASLMQLVGKEGTLDLMATVGFYATLGFILNTFEPPLDDAVAAEISGHPLAQ